MSIKDRNGDLHSEKDGKFIPKDKGAEVKEALERAGMNGVQRPNASAKKKSSNPKIITKLSKDEYRILRESCERIHRGFKGVSVKCGDTHYVTVNKKLVAVSGSYPYVIDHILSFRSHEKQIEFLKELKRRK